MPDVQLTPLVSSDDRMHVMDRTCWCEPKILPGWWGDHAVVVHRPEPAQIDGGNAMPVSRLINPPCEKCGAETLRHSDPSGGWNECPSCHHMQDIRLTPPGEGKLSPLFFMDEAESALIDGDPHG